MLVFLSFYFFCHVSYGVSLKSIQVSVYEKEILPIPVLTAHCSALAHTSHLLIYGEAGAEVCTVDATVI